MMIEVRVNADMVAKFNQNEVLFNRFVIEKLEERGVPVVGAISVQGVKVGRLWMNTDETLDGDKEFVYTYEGPVTSTKPKPKAKVIAEEEEL